MKALVRRLCIGVASFLIGAWAALGGRRRMKAPPSSRSIFRAGVELYLFEAPLFRRVPPVVGPKVAMPVVHWTVVVPSTGVAVAGGLALTQHGAERKAWKAFDAWQAGRLRWMDPDFTDDALCRPFDPTNNPPGETDAQ